MADYRIIMVNPDQLDRSPHQPKTRIEASGPMKHLQNSIKDIGLQYPPLVIAEPNDRYQIVDGHRRIAAIGQLGWPKIPVLVTHGKADSLFAGVSGNVAKMKAHEWVHVFLNGGVVPSGPTKVCISKLEEIMGREFLKQLIAKEPPASPTIWNVSNRVLRTLEMDEANRPEILKWLLKNSPRTIATWITNGYSIDELRRAFKENRNPEMEAGKIAA